MPLSFLLCMLQRWLQGVRTGERKGSMSAGLGCSGDIDGRAERGHSISHTGYQRRKCLVAWQAHHTLGFMGMALP